MAVRIPWDKYEAAILLDSSLKVVQKKMNRVDAIKQVSNLLRQLATNKGIAIDSIYRNENGISMQMSIMTALLEDKPYGLHKASKLFIDIVKMYKYHKNSFERLLTHAMESTNMILQINFSDIANVSFTKPLKLIYNENVYTDFSNWSQLYVKLLSLLYNDFDNTISSLIGKNIYGNGRMEISISPDGMIAPKEFSNNMFVETNISATDTVKKISYLLDICKINRESVLIYYQKKENVNSDNKGKDIMVHKISQSNNSTHSYTDSTKMVSIINVLKSDYENGFRFDTTSIKLLLTKSDCNIDSDVTNELKKIMFKRKDDVYFLVESIANPLIITEIINCSNAWLDKYGFFEATVLYDKYSSAINQSIILDIDDFIKFYEFINTNRYTRCVTSYHARIIRINDNIANLSHVLINSLINTVYEDYCGTINEYELQELIPAFSIDLLDRIIKECSDELIRTKINDITCYQTLDALGVPENFSDTIVETLDLIENINLTPSVDVVHTVLSINLSCNFKKEYNIPDDKTFKKIIETYFNGEQSRKWIRGIFLEEHNNV